MAPSRGSLEPVPRGLDIGTDGIVAAKKVGGKYEFKRERDAFLTLNPVSKVNKSFLIKGIESRGGRYLEKDGIIYVLGKIAIDMANERQEESRRPMNSGVISPKEKESIPIISEIIKGVLGAPVVKGEPVFFSVPANPIDQNFDN